MSDSLLGFSKNLSNDLEAHSNVTCPVTGYAVSYLLKRHRKRFAIARDELTTRYMEEFVVRNATVRAPTLSAEVVVEARDFILSACENFFSSVNPLNIQVDFDKAYAYSQWRFGPGASNGVRGTHTAEKIDQPFTVTRGCLGPLSEVASANPYLREKISRGDWYSLASGSRLTAVPKNEDSVRIIAIEPSGNMFLQLALGACLEDILASVGLDIRLQQDKNKWLARLGSIDDSLATIDLSAASDSISIELVRLLFTDDWFNAFMSCRSTHASIDGNEIELRMISTMGNGYTFPMMTLIFLSLVYANRRVNHRGPRHWIDYKSTAVFGDDIIVPSTEATGLFNILEQAGFSVNTEKSFTSGPFRESCGGDYYAGVQVTPFYVRSLNCDSEIYVAINKVLRWCAEQDLFLQSTLEFLISLLRKRTCFVPEWDADTAGIRTCYVSKRYHRHEPTSESFPYNGDYSMMLACGGYLSPSGDNNLFLPRPRKTRYRLVKDRLPHGFLDGRSSVDYSDRVSADVLQNVLWLKTL